MNRMLEITRVDVWSLFKVVFLLYAAVGVVVGFFYWFVLVVAGGIGSAFLEDADIPNLGFLGGALGIFLIPVMAFFYGAMCGLMSLIGGALFNQVVRISGGLKLEMGEVVEVRPASPQPQSPPQETV